MNEMTVEEFEKEGEEFVPVRKDLIKRLYTLPKLIRVKEMEVMNFSNNASLNEMDFKEREALIMTEIATETVKEFKLIKPTKKYKNEDARQGELTKRLNGDLAYKKIHDNWEHNKEKKQKSEIQLKFLVNTFNATKWLVRLFCYEEEIK